MQRSLWSAALGMITQQQNVDVIANNLANVNTNGYKKARAEFQDLVYQTLRVPGIISEEPAPGRERPVGVQIGHGVRLSAVKPTFTQGILEETDNPLDVAILGDGFFAVTLPDGSFRFTRDGSFKLDSSGRLVTSDGYAVLGGYTADGYAFPAGPIVIGPEVTEIVIREDGSVMTRRGESDAFQRAGQILLARFTNPGGLERVGKNLFASTAASGEPQYGAPASRGFGVVSQRMLERSNIEIVQEMVNLITAQRAYEICSKAVQTSDEMAAMANNLRR